MIKKYILAREYDEEGFDYDGAGDYDDFGRYRHKKKKPNFSSIEEYCKEFDFRLYERKI